MADLFCGKVGEVGMRLIDADALADALFEKRKNYPQWVAEVIGDMQEAVVQCRDCKHGKSRKNAKGEDMIDCLLADNWLKNPSWYCADGEAKE